MEFLFCVQQPTKSIDAVKMNKKEAKIKQFGFFLFSDRSYKKYNIKENKYE